ncbi:MAG TPA: phenylalanine--tRNA ligase subunit beta, partial [Gemmatimonadales bacterium]|nr:phenylalanine--tRNA ligase subunit beta [Gemmatimonadales bacterium]
MNVSRRWLEEFLRRPLEVRDLGERLTLLGAPVDAVEPLHADLSDILVATVEEVRPHPNADRLRLCVVNGGAAERQNVVCGASNVTAGRKYPFAPVGATLPGGLRIEERKLRGEKSQGMLCSARELGLGQDGEGLWELQTDAPPGTPLLEALPLADHRLVIDVGPNRPDLLGHKGVARELAASYGVPFRLPPLPGTLLDVPPVRRAGHVGVVGGVRAGTEDEEGCPRLLGAVLRGVRIAPSPSWLAGRLEAVGVRSINNVVDATNYVMLELNQPTHAYDLAKLTGPSVVARKARSGETITTLDGVSRALTADMTIIADDAGPIGVAGVMGGAATEVTGDTSDIFLECAYFTPALVRRTRRALGLSTEASYRFERGIDRWGGVEALRRCIEIIGATAGGQLVEAPVDTGPGPGNPARIFLRPSRVSQVLGVDLPGHAIEQYLVAIGATVVPKPEDERMAVEAPSWRPDLVREIDLVEEVARLHGYQHFPSDLRAFRPSQLADAPIERATAEVRAGLARQGLLEVLPLPLARQDGSESVRLANPLSSTEGYLRRRLLPGLVALVERNWSQHVSDVRLFELGTVFTAAAEGQRPLEERHVAAVMTGRREPSHWSGTGEGRIDLWDLKGHFEAAVALAVPGGAVQVEGSQWIARDARGRVVGHAAKLEADAPPWADPLFGFELVLDPAPRRPPQFTALPATPASERVLALLLPEGVSAGRVETVLRRAGGALLERVEVESDYRGPELPAGVRSVAFRLVFRAPDRTLRDAEVDQAETRLLAALADELGV